MQLYECRDDFWTIFRALLTPSLSHFWPYPGLYRAIFGDHLGTKIGPFWVIFGWFWTIFWGRSGVTLDSLRDHFGVVLVSFWGSSWPHFEAFLSYFLDPFWTIFARVLGIFTVILWFVLVMFWEVDCNIKQNDAREVKMCKFLPNFTNIMQICANLHVIVSRGTCPPQRNEYSKPNRIMASYGSAMSGIVGQCAVFMQLLQAHTHVGTVALPTDPAAAAGTACAPTYLQRAVHSCAAPKPCYNFARGDFPQRFRLRPANKHGQPWQQTPLLVVFPGVSTCVRYSRVIKDLSHVCAIVSSFRSFVRLVCLYVEAVYGVLPHYSTLVQETHYLLFSCLRCAASALLLRYVHTACLGYVLLMGM